MLKLELPLPPSVNTYYRRHGHIMHISHAGKRFRTDVIAVVFPLRLKPLEGELSLSVEIYPATKRPVDLDNRIKALQDGLQHAGVFADDNQIARLLVERREVVKGGKCVVTIEALRPLAGNP